MRCHDSHPGSATRKVNKQEAPTRKSSSTGLGADGGPVGRCPRGDLGWAA